MATSKKEKPKPKPAGDEKEKPASRSRSRSSGSGAGKGGAGAGSYWQQTKLPVYCLTFVLPMVLFYEVAIVIVNQPIVATRGYEVRITADVLIREAMGGLLKFAGLPAFFMSGLLIALVLLGWQLVSRKPWEVKAGTLLGMLGESAAIGLVLYLIIKFVVPNLLMWKMTIENDSAPWLYHQLFREIVLSMGAGVYEEFIFRLLLVWVFALIVAGLTSLAWERSLLIAVLLSALAFSGVHRLGMLGEPFTWGAFVFRACYGAVFGAVYYFRGFGVAVGGHALYDVFVCLDTYFTASHGSA